MKKAIIIVVAVIVVGGLSLAYYYLVYKPGLTDSNSPMEGAPCIITSSVTATEAEIRNMPGVIQNGLCVPGITGNASSERMTVIQANDILNTYAIKDPLGNVTLNYNGANFDQPNLSSFPTEALQNLLKNGWWMALLTGGTVNGFKIGSNGNYILAIYDLRNPSASINTGKSKVYIPASFQPYLNI